MRLRSLTFVLLFAAGVLAACQSSPNSYLPQSGGSPAYSSPALSAHWPLGGPMPEAASLCNVHPVHVPGKHIVLIANGTLKGSTFTTLAGGGFWFLEPYTVGTPGPTPTPGVTPTPGGPPEWIYYGTYTLKHKHESGCALLIATQSGKPFKKSKANAIGLGTVVTRQKWVNIGLYTALGPLTMKITGISATGGHGSASLKTRKGAKYDTATITLVGRISSP
jgi:hypothetical protein